MSYTKTTWKDNTSPAINQDNLNKIENGIYNLHNTALYVENQVDALVNKVNNNDSNSVNLKSRTESTIPSINEAYEYTGPIRDSTEEQRQECAAIKDKTAKDLNTIRNTITDLSLWDEFHVFSFGYYVERLARAVCEPYVISDNPNDPMCYYTECVLYFHYMDGMPDLFTEEDPDPDPFIEEEEEDPHLIGGGGG